MQTISPGGRAAEQTARSTIDGRTARRNRNRNAVLDAVIEFFREGNLSPGVHEVSRRSGVSLRSVYRYFDDVDALIAAAIRRHFELSKPFFTIAELGDGPLDVRIERFCTARIGLFEQVRTVYSAATVRARVDRQVADGLRWCRAQLSRQTEAMFAPELDAMSSDDLQVAELTLDVLTQFETLELLRGARALSVDETVRYLADTFGDVLG